MARNEFTRKTKDAAWERAGAQCEATGALYGLPEGQRCTGSLHFGVHYDHVNPDRNSRDNSLENCAAVCPGCHRWKTANRDIPMIAKTNRQQSLARNTKTRKGAPMPGSRASRWKKPMNGPAVRR